MWPYFLLVLCIVVLQFEIGSYNTKKYKFIMGTVLLFLFAALRGNGHGDYFTYLSRGKNIISLYDVFHNHTAMEPGYCLIAYITNKLNLPAQCIIITMNLISITCICKFIKKYSSDWCFSLLLFLPLFFQFDMHAARTAVAISISTLSLEYVEKRKFIYFSIIIFIASLFHSTAWIVLPIYFLSYIKLDLVLSLGIIIVEMFFVKVIGVDKIILTTLKYSGMDSFYSRYLTYVESVTYGYPFRLYDPRLLLVILIYVIAKICYRKTSRKENLIINCCFFNIIFLILFSEHTFLAYRFSAFFNSYIIVLVPMVINKFYSIMLIYKNKYLIRKNIVCIRFGCLFLFTVWAMAYAYNFVKTGIDYRLFFNIGEI